LSAFYASDIFTCFTKEIFMLKRLLLLLFCCAPLVAFSQGQIAKANGIAIWYETFGEKENTPLLLIMGGCCQGVLWPKVFCEKLAKEGFYVVRYDHRDMGLSTYFDFAKEPYYLMDLVDDAIGLMDAIEIKKAHLFGLSMGAGIAQIMAAHYPERIASITVMGSTCDLRPMNLGLAGLPPEENPLVSPPTTRYLAWMQAFIHRSPETEEGKLTQRIGVWAMLNGEKLPFNEKISREIHSEFLARCKYPEGIANHIQMLRDEKSEGLIRSTLSKIKVPTIILHGSEDPIFPPDHGEALHRLIEGSEYHLVEGMGHVPNDQLFDLYIDCLKRQAKTAK
jgi:pimeloyl-ACP methyl ester carboxylesterase